MPSHFKICTIYRTLRGLLKCLMNAWAEESLAIGFYVITILVEKKKMQILFSFSNFWLAKFSLHPKILNYTQTTRAKDMHVACIAAKLFDASTVNGAVWKALSSEKVLEWVKPCSRVLWRAPPPFFMLWYKAFLWIMAGSYTFRTSYCKECSCASETKDAVLLLQNLEAAPMTRISVRCPVWWCAIWLLP